MKIRAGFISNSSSSSFIVAFPADFAPTVANIRAYLFGKRTAGLPAYEGGEPLSLERAAGAIYAQMRGVKPNDQHSLLRALGGGLHGEPDMGKFGIDLRHPNPDKVALDVAWRAWSDATERHHLDYLARHAPSLPGGADLYAFTFWDNNGDGTGATLMHNYGFTGVPHLARVRGGKIKIGKGRA
jgi:hypothetical protein